MKTNYKKYLAEGTLIIFSVLFALFINKLFDDYQTNQKKATALKSIEQELLRNQGILENWKQKHSAVRDRISSILEGESDSLKAELREYDYLNLGVLTNNESLIDAILINTAWESAKSTGIVAEFDFETTQTLTLAYSMQEVLTERTLAKILDYYFDTSSHDMQNLDPILIQFQLRFWELSGQEELLVTVYKDALEQLSR